MPGVGVAWSPPVLLLEGVIWLGCVLCMFGVLCCCFQRLFSSLGMSLIFMARSAVQVFSWLSSWSVTGFSCLACDSMGVRAVLCFDLGTPMSDILSSVSGALVTVTGILALVLGISIVLRAL